MKKQNVDGIPFKELNRLLKEALEEEKNPPLSKIKDLGNGLILVNEEDYTWSTPIPESGFPYIVEDKNSF